MGEAINEWLTGLIGGAVTPALQTAGALMDPSRLTTTATLHRLWADSRSVANTVFVLFVIAGGIVVLGFETLQTRYAIKQIAPRLVFGWLAANLSWPLITTVTQLAAAVAVAVAGTNVRPGDILGQLVSATTSDGPTFLVILTGVIAVLAVVLTLTLIVIIAVMLGLTVLAPLALCLHALPHTEAIAWWWWRSFAAVLAVPTLHALLLALLARVLLTTHGLAVGVFGLPVGIVGPGSLLTLLVVIALLYLMIKIPGWVLRAAIGSGGRRGFLRSVASSALLSAGLAAVGVPVPAVAGRAGVGLLASGRGVAALRVAQSIRRRGNAATSRRLAASVSASTRHPAATGNTGSTATAGPSDDDPYSRVRVARGGQLLLPLPGLVPRTPSAPTAPALAPSRQPARGATTPGAATRRGNRAPGPSSTRTRVRRGRQLSLPLGQDWPEQRPVVGRDGQYRLPITTTRVPSRHSPAPPATTTAPGSSGRPGPGQLPLPLTWPSPAHIRPQQPRQARQARVRKGSR